MANMNDEQLFYAAHNMYEQGGGFASAIAQAFFRADRSNKAKLLHAFADLFERYAPTPTPTTTEGEDE